MIEKNEYGIAKWRIDSDEERKLALSADDSPEGKRAYVEYYRVNDAEYFANGLPMIEKTLEKYGVVAKGDEKRIIVEDMIYSLHRFGFSFDEYFEFKIKDKNSRERGNYITEKHLYQYYTVLNSSKEINLLNNKALTLEHFKEYIGRDFMFIPKLEGGGIQREEITQFLANHGDVIIKPVDESCGKGIFIVRAGEMSVDDLIPKLPGNGAVIEECIAQSAEMAAFHPESINTVRLPCFLCADGVHIVRPYMRMGKGSSVVDNAGQGGLFVPVDLCSGRMLAVGYDEWGETFKVHPDSKIIFSDFIIPDWREAIELAEKLMSMVPECKYVGWDLSHTNNGWVLIEGNPRAQQVAQQIMAGHGLKNEWENYIEMM